MFESAGIFDDMDESVLGFEDAENEVPEAGDDTAAADDAGADSDAADAAEDDADAADDAEDSDADSDDAEADDDELADSGDDEADEEPEEAAEEDEAVVGGDDLESQMNPAADVVAVNDDESEAGQPEAAPAASSAECGDGACDDVSAEDEELANSACDMDSPAVFDVSGLPDMSH